MVRISTDINLINSHINYVSVVANKTKYCSYTNDLNDALLQKQGNTFWNCWRSKFSSKNPRPLQIDKLTGDLDIAEHFACHFKNISAIKTVDGNKKLQDIYTKKRSSYSGTPFSKDFAFDAELTEDLIQNLKRGKAAGLDGISAEHLQHCHPCLPTFLAKLFNLIIETGTVPDKFGLSYTIPLPKGNTASMSKSLTASDFRGISISPVLSKVFENCILQRYKHFFSTSDNQFGFKKLSGCSHAIYTVRQTVEYFTKSGTTINLCSLDLSKAFDKVNHFGLYNKLMIRAIPVNATKSTGTLVLYSDNMCPFWIGHVFFCLFRMWRPSRRCFITSSFQYIY